VNVDRLAGHVALVTGGGQGLGRAIAQELGRDGASIAILELNAATGAAVARQLVDAGIEARSYQADVARSEEVDEVVARASSDFGFVDILVNNAGISGVGSPTHEVDDALWQASIGVMQSGIFYSSRAVARGLIAARRPGSIIHISSIRGFSPKAGRLAYSAAKAAEWGAYGIRGNAVAPGVQKTPMWDADVERGVTDEEEFLRLIPLGRLGDPTEVGRLCAFLASAEASYITGSTITIDGGLTTVPSG